MSILDKLKFWKKGDDFGSDSLPGLEGGMDFGQNLGLPSSGMPGMPQEPGHDFSPHSGMPQQGFSPPQQQGFQPSGFSQQAFQSPSPSSGSSADMQILSAKLDAIKASLDSLNHRLASIERLAYGEQEEQKGRYQW